MKEVRRLSVGSSCNRPRVLETVYDLGHRVLSLGYNYLKGNILKCKVDGTRS